MYIIIIYLYTCCFVDLMLFQGTTPTKHCITVSHRRILCPCHGVSQFYLVFYFYLLQKFFVSRLCRPFSFLLLNCHSNQKLNWFNYHGEGTWCTQRFKNTLNEIVFEVYCNRRQLLLRICYFNSSNLGSMHAIHVVQGNAYCLTIYSQLNIAMLGFISDSAS